MTTHSAASTDEELVLAVQAGDTESLGTLVARWEQPLFRFVYRMIPTADDARDICQETFLRILKKANRYQKGSRFSTWMYQIALNLCRDQARRRRRWKLIVDEEREVDDRVMPSGSTSRTAGGDPWEAVSRREQSEALSRAMNVLSAEQREVLILKEFESLKFREIGEILGCPESTVKSRLYHGMRGLRAALENQGIVSGS